MKKYFSIVFVTVSLWACAARTSTPQANSQAGVASTASASSVSAVGASSRSVANVASSSSSNAETSEEDLSAQEKEEEDYAKTYPQKLAEARKGCQYCPASLDNYPYEWERRQDVPCCSLPRRPLPGPYLFWRNVEISGPGKIAPDYIRRIVRAMSPVFRRCYEAGLRQDPIPKGVVAVTFVIGDQGEVESAVYAGGKLADENVQECVVRVYKNLSFPAPEGGKVTVRFPINFQYFGQRKQ